LIEGIVGKGIDGAVKIATLVAAVVVTVVVAVGVLALIAFMYFFR